MSRVCLLMLFVLAAPASHAAERWQSLPAAPAPVVMARRGHVENQGARLYYAIVGNGSPVLLLHGGLGSSDHWH